MDISNVLNSPYGNNLEIHYYFNDESHFMDAQVRHKLNGELLTIFKEAALLLDVDIIIESEAIKEGGLIEKLKIYVKKNKRAILKTTLGSVFLPLVVVAITDKITTNKDLEDSTIKLNNSSTSVNEKKVEEIDSNIELIKAQKEETDLRKRKLKNDLIYDSINSVNLPSDSIIYLTEEQFSKIYPAIHLLNTNPKIIVHKTNYYKSLNSYSKIISVRTEIKSNNNQLKFPPIVVDRKDFNDYIIEPQKLDPEFDENATIEIISPVLKKGAYHWKGLYKGLPIDFLMEDKLFKKDIINQKEAFKNGTFITCVLKINKKLDEMGSEKITGYSVQTVILKDDGIVAIETPQGKLYKAKKEADKKQLSLFQPEEK